MTLTALAALAGVVSLALLSPSLLADTPESTLWLVSLPQTLFCLVLAGAMAALLGPPRPDLARRFGVLRWVFVLVAVLPVLLYGGGVVLTCWCRPPWSRWRERVPGLPAVPGPGRRRGVGASAADAFGGVPAKRRAPPEVRGAALASCDVLPGVPQAGTTFRLTVASTSSCTFTVTWCAPGT